MKKLRRLLPLAMLFGLAGAAGSAQAENAVVRYDWKTPTQRENGEVLTPQEIGGYELRVQQQNGEDLQIVIQDPAATHFELTEQVHGNYTASIAVYDSDGLYSAFVDVTGKVNSIPPKSPDEFTSSQLPFANAVERCMVERLCRVYTPSQ